MNAKPTDHIQSGVSGKPERHVDAGRDRFTADGDDLSHPVREAHDEPGPWVQIDFGVRAEGAGSGMHHRHFGQAEHHGAGREARDGVTQDHCGPGVPDGEAAAHEQAGADGAAESDHHDLRAAELLVKPALARGDAGLIHAVLFETGLVVHSRAARGVEDPHQSHAGR
jgi:hypothetical protein